jgi:hypothetical protein
MTKNKKIVPASLTENQKLVLKKAILAEYPNVRGFEDELDFLIEQYSKDKNYVEKLMKSADANKQFEEDIEAQAGLIKNISKGDKEYDELLERFEKAKQEEILRLEKIREQEEKEKAENKTSINVIS